MWPPLVNRLLNLVEIAILLAGLATVAGYFGALWWPLDLAAHFRLQYSIILIVATAVAAAGSRWRLAAISLMLAAPNLLALAPFFIASPGNAPNGKPVRIVSFNVHTENTRFTDVLNYLTAQNADAVFLMEVNQEWLRHFDSLIARYPHVLLRPSEDNFGLAFLTRLPIESLDERDYGDAHVPSALARVNMNGQRFAIIATHPVPPAGSTYAALRNQQLRNICAEVRAIGIPVLVIGDLNVTPWSVNFKELIHCAQLRDTAIGRGLHPTWGPFWGLRIPIDHALISDGLRVVGRRIGPVLGSDHHTLELEFGPE